MGKIASNKKILAAVTIIGLGCLFFAKFPFDLISGVVGLGSGFRLLRITQNGRNSDAFSVQKISKLLADYEEIIGGHLWSGKDAEILARVRMDNPSEPGPVIFQYICKTKNGAWFFFEVGVVWGRVVHIALNPCNEAAAKECLQRHKKVYARFFGQPAHA